MSEIRKEQETITVFKTSDGEKFYHEESAQRHQDIIDGKIEVCDLCGGDGMNPYHSRHVVGSEPECPYCGGSGNKKEIK